MNKPEVQEALEVGQLFEAELEYRDAIEAIVPTEGREGVLIGSGDGSVWGEWIRGRIRWSMYSGNCAYLMVKAGIDPPPGQHLCTVNPAGVIETNDQAEIWFDARGYGLRAADPSAPHIWQLTMSLRFETSDDRYRWLNSTIATWHGRFDELAGRATYRAFAAVPESGAVAAELTREG